MTRTTTVTVCGQELEVVYDYEPPTLGGQFDPPDPSDVDIEKVYIAFPICCDMLDIFPLLNGKQLDLIQEAVEEVAGEDE